MVLTVITGKWLILFLTFFIKILIPDLGKLIKKYRFAQKKKYHGNLTAWDNTCNNLVTVDFTRT